MNTKVIVAAVLILAAIAYGASAFFDTTVEYSTFSVAQSSHKKMQVKGEWIREKGASYDPERNVFSFAMRDEAGTEMTVEYAGAKPNNFELAQAVVIKGRCEDGKFHASEILTKCPSKYDAASPAADKGMQQ